MPFEPADPGKTDQTVFYYLFYRLYLFLADTPVQLDSGDFCVMSRRAGSASAGLRRSFALSAGLRAWLGLPGRAFPRSPLDARRRRSSIFVRDTHQARSLRSDLFLHAASQIGFICGSFLCFCAVLRALIYTGIALFTNTRIAAARFSTLVVILLFSNGMIFLYLGVWANTSGQIFMEVKGRPSCAR